MHSWTRVQESDYKVAKKSYRKNQAIFLNVGAIGFNLKEMESFKIA